MAVHFSPVILDLLQEVTNIGCGNAATALSKMLNKRIDMRVPRVQALPLKDVPEFLGGADALMSGIYIQVRGEMSCSILFLLDENSVGKMLSLLFGGGSLSGVESPLQQSALMEVGNILGSAYMGALAEFTQLSFQLSTPAFANDMLGAIIDVALVQLSGYSDSALVIENSFWDGEESVRANFLMLPEPELPRKLCQALEVPIDG